MTTTAVPPAPAGEFHPEDHTYWRGAQQLHSVTRSLSSGLGLDTSWYTEESAYRGSYVHEACLLLDQNDLHWPTVKPEYRGYIESWRKWIELARPQWRLMETPLYDHVRGFAGTPDRVGVLAGNPVEAVVEIKTPNVKRREWDLQEASYGHLARPGCPMRRISVRLRPGGSLPLIDEASLQDYFADLQVFFAILRVAHWKQNGK